jgi:hypothetical protein
MDHFRPAYYLEAECCKRRMILPRQSPLGKFEGLVNQPTAEWPATFLCITCGRLSEYSDAVVREDQLSVTAPDARFPDLWRVELKYGRKNYGKNRAIYTTYPAGASEDHVREVVVRRVKAISYAEGFSFEPNKERIQLQRFEQ